MDDCAADLPWYVTAFDRSYVERYAHRDHGEAERQVGLLLRHGHLRSGQRVLDLCCGAGRHLAALGRHALPAVGVDLSAELLAAARQANDRIPLVRADMLRLPFAAAAFHAVVQMFTAFGYFDDDQANRQVLHEVARVLRPGGTYALDLMNRDVVVHSLRQCSEGMLPDGSMVVETRRYDPVRRRVEKVIRTGRRPPYRESVRVFDLAEIRAWLEQAGMAVGAVYGDYAGAAYDPAGSPRMLVVSRRA